jgi:hypothetical protein
MGQETGASGDEGNEHDKVTFFENGYVQDDDLAKILRENCIRGAKVVLLNDRSCSRTNWDIPKIEEAERTWHCNIIAITACLDHE